MPLTFPTAPDLPPATGGSGDGVTVHNLLSGRTVPATHPADAIAAEVDGLAATNVGEALAELLDLSAGEVYVQADAPDEPADPANAVWFPAPDGLVTFVDFRSLPDGDLADLLTDTNGGGTLDPLTLDEVLSGVGSPGVIQNGRLTHAVGSSPSRNIPLLDTGVIGETWRITYGHGGITERDTALGVGEASTLNITFTRQADAGDGYILHASAFEKASAGLGSGNATYIAIGRDDNGVATLSFTPPEIAVVERFLDSGDRVALASLGGGDYAGYLNGVETVTFTDATYDPATRDLITTPINSLDGSTWRNSMEWLAVTTGADFDPDTDLLPPHRWNGTQWVPATDPSIPGAVQRRLVALERASGDPVVVAAADVTYDDASLADASTVDEALTMIGHAAVYALRSDGAGDYIIQNPGGDADSPTSIPAGAVKVFHGPDDPTGTTTWGGYVEACDQWIDPGTHHKIRNLANSAWVDI